MKKILFTGGTSGIAYHTIQKLLEGPYQIYVTCHTDLEVERMQKRYRSYSNVECFRLDLRREQDFLKVKELSVDILVANAAIGEGGLMWEVPIDKVRDNFEVNVFQNLRLIQMVLTDMLVKGHGKVIIMASLAGIMPLPFLGSYCATKSSLIAIANTLRMELALCQSSISVTLIEPGLYHTGFNQVMLEEGTERISKNSPFYEELLQISMLEKKGCRWLEKDSYDSITKKIVAAIQSEHPKKIYRAPFLQVAVAKIYQTFFC